MLGIDIVDINRIDTQKTIISHVLTELEMKEYCAKHTQKQKILYFAGRFAAKEAIFKATQDKDYLTYSILNDSTGKPYIKDHPDLEISISHDAGIAIAIVKNT
ncbi:MAG: 4'-phosphopantetheinyl transferase superfamily protein [Erysipelotrichaceae bacterium]|nr:4'-phosphopantetheinyl transferase superfamily protein [Erysipelotrichaceae bacterium]MDY6034603.1 4'-phosphopantetheinyl transferase superfamily protein [Bulleidia sp.]